MHCLSHALAWLRAVLLRPAAPGRHARPVHGQYTHQPHRLPQPPQRRPGGTRVYTRQRNVSRPRAVSHVLAHDVYLDSGELVRPYVLSPHERVAALPNPSEVIA
ncbi:hypothetical protein QCN29_00400 [Streptomyces sp. HNM0663]|uniref:Secreted protein n=1 Tax=Streptomyces chengmaiensis TaxID=3040919 RepID=A0ABT6HET2_9ACTN|nr:hypothetical protein [Streptomyces chengmaiensis]MDH2387269.1 hypothetical protein [Streptomyces chengmaiensis]